jgi:hypothetical protein
MKNKNAAESSLDFKDINASIENESNKHCLIKSKSEI